MLKLLLALWQRLPASIRLYVYCTVWKQSRERYGATDFFIQKLPFNLYLKKGVMASQEAAALRFVRPHVTIPVPFVLDSVGEFFIMTGLPGEPLGTVFSKMEPDEVARVRDSLSEFVHQLRAIPNDAQGVVSGPQHRMPCCDVNRVDDFEFGPFPSVFSFHSFLLSHVPLQHREEVATVAEVVHSKPHTVYFTHGDLNLRNILFENGQVTGIVDWTCAGWYPGYWELAKAVYVHQRFKKWRDLCASILPGYEEELHLEEQIWTATQT